MRRVFRRWTTAAVVAASVLGSTLASASTPLDTIAAAASGTNPAERIVGYTDAITVFNRTNAVQPAVIEATGAAAADAGGAWALGRGATIGLRTVWRAGTATKQAPSGYQYPLSVTALPVNAIGPLIGLDVSAVAAAGQVAISAAGAAFNNIAVGDVVELVAANGSSVMLTVGLIADDTAAGGTELIMSIDTATLLGLTIDTRIVVWGFSSRAALDAALTTRGLATRTDTRIRRSWDAFDPDLTLSLLQTKQLLGEFAYRLTNSDQVGQSADWVNAWLPSNRILLSTAIQIRARCNNTINADLTAALNEVAAAGLGWAIDVANANTYGGCHNPRFNRISAALGSLSRHAWGGALDTNTTTNAQGSTPRMNCDVVRIFRRHNFAWGGNFLTPDGMHFEWVGAARDQFAYPSKYCPNTPSGGSPTAEAAEPDGYTARATLFADDGWADGDH